MADPNVLADVQKALQFKSHVEEQLRSGVSKQETVLTPHASLPSSPNPYVVRSPLALSEGLSGRLQESELDFSPSVDRVQSHPVPNSADDGATLDWSGFSDDGEKRDRKWSMHLSRKHSKDKSSPVSNKGIVEKQEAIYAGAYCIRLEVLHSYKLDFDRENHYD